MTDGWMDRQMDGWSCLQASQVLSAVVMISALKVNCHQHS